MLLNYRQSASFLFVIITSIFISACVSDNGKEDPKSSSSISFSSTQIPSSSSSNGLSSAISSMPSPSSISSQAVSSQPSSDPSATMDIIVNATGNAWGLIESVPAGIQCATNACFTTYNCPKICSTTVSADQVTLQASGLTHGYSALGENELAITWGGDCSGSSQRCELTGPGTKTVDVNVALSKDLKVASFVLINADTGLPIPGYTSLVDGAIIDLDTISQKNITLEIKASAPTYLMDMTLNGSPVAKDWKAPFTLSHSGGITVATTPWDLSAGDYVLEATPKLNGGKLIGDAATLNFTLLKTEVGVSKKEFIFSAIEGETAARQEFELSNTGGVVTAYSLENIPPWLTVIGSNISGNLAVGEKKIIVLASEFCQNILLQTGNITVIANGKNIAMLNVNLDCVSGSATTNFTLDRFYVNQAVPAADSNNRQNTTPIISGKPGLLRAFVTRTGTDPGMPINVKVYWEDVDGTQGSIDLAGPAVVPASIKEKNLTHTFNAQVPGSFFKIGRKIYIQAESENNIAESSEIDNRYPISGDYSQLNIDTVDDVAITFIPIAIDGELPDLSPIKVQYYIDQIMAMYPFATFDVEIRPDALMMTGSETMTNAMANIASLRKMDGVTNGRIYMGITSKYFSKREYAGVATIGGRAAASHFDLDVVLHELGHLLNLGHAPCGVASLANNSDWFPHPNAEIGVFGFNIYTKHISPPSSKDVMSFCSDPEIWISDFNYKEVYKSKKIADTYYNSTPLKTARFSIRTSKTNSTYTQKSLIIGGGETGGNYFIDQHYSAEITPQNVAHSQVQSNYRIIAKDKNGRNIFDYPIVMQFVPHEDSRRFLVTLPYVNVDTLHTLTLTHFGKNVLTQPIQSTVIHEFKKARLDYKENGLIDIYWDNQAFDKLIVKKQPSGNTIAFNSNGKLTISTKNNKTIELVYFKGFSEYREALTIP